YVIDSGNAMVDELLNRGGLDSMMYTVSMTIVAMTFGGVLEYSGILKEIMDRLLQVVKTTGGLIDSTIGSSFFTNTASSSSVNFKYVSKKPYIKRWSASFNCKRQSILINSAFTCTRSSSLNPILLSSAATTGLSFFT